VSAAQNKLKGKISRALASKCALCIRVDALGIFFSKILIINNKNCR